MIAYAPPPPIAAMVEKAPARQGVSDLLRIAAEGLEENRVEFSDYVRQAWSIVESQPLIPAWHLDCISEYVQAVLDGQITRLIINAPPRLGKSLPVSVFAPTWQWTRNPATRFINVSYAQDLATKHNVDRRRIIESDFYRSRWGEDVAIADDQNVKKQFESTAHGHMVARGTGAGITGFGADVIILDDPLNPELAESDTERTKGKNYYDKTLYSRLDNKKTGKVILVEQRLHHKDMTAHFLAQSHENWVHLKLPAEAPKRTVITFPITGRKIIREKGDVLSPEREGKDVLRITKKTLGKRWYGAQYQQEPSEQEGNIFLRKHWRYWESLPKFDEICQTWDCTFKDLISSDYVVGQIWGIKGPDAYLLDQARGQWDFTKTLAKFKLMTKKWPTAHRKLVEDKANGTAVENVLRREIGGMIMVNPAGGKVARAYAAQPYQEAGNIYLPDPEVHLWVQDFITECAEFPDGENDDQVDAMTQLLNDRFTKKKMLRVIS